VRDKRGGEKGKGQVGLSRGQQKGRGRKGKPKFQGDVEKKKLKESNKPVRRRKKGYYRWT